MNNITVLIINLEISHKAKKCLPAILLLSIYPKEIKTYIHKKNFTQLSILTLFIIALN